MASLFRENKTLFILIGVGIFLIELEIFAVAALNSGRKSWMQIKDKNGNVINMTEGNSLSSFNKYYFEKTFGPLSQYQVNWITRDVPFPFRAWFAAAIGIPVGAMLLFAFITRAFAALIYGDRTTPDLSDETDAISAPATRIEALLAGVSRLNIFTIGFLALLAVFTYWVVPNLIQYVGHLGVDTVIRFKWFFMTTAGIVLGIVLWIIYLRYLLAKKTIDSQMEIEKFRLQLVAGQAPSQLASSATTGLLTSDAGSETVRPMPQSSDSSSPLNRP